MNNLAIAPDGKSLASGSDDQTVRLWRLETGKEARVRRLSKLLESAGPGCLPPRRVLKEFEETCSVSASHSLKQSPVTASVLPPGANASDRTRRSWHSQLRISFDVPMSQRCISAEIYLIIDRN